MPALGADMSAGTLVEWRKRPGDPIERGEIIADVHTDKADIEVEVFTSGIVDRLLVEPGQKVPVGTPLALIREDGEVPREAPAPRPEPAEAARILASPSAKSLADELGVDLATIRGSGPKGRIQRRDVEAAARGAAPQAPAPPPSPAPPPAAPAETAAAGRPATPRRRCGRRSPRRWPAPSARSRTST